MLIKWNKVCLHTIFFICTYKRWYLLQVDKHKFDHIGDESLEKFDTSTDIVFNESKQISKRIVNGTRAILGQFPQQASTKKKILVFTM